MFSLPSVPQPRRFVGRRVRNPCRHSLALAVIMAGYSISAFWMRSKSSSWSSASKGELPTSISYMSTPSDHQSTALV